MQKLSLFVCGLICICTTFWHMHVKASSWNATLLVNTEAFSVIDEGDGTDNVIIRFGDTLNKTITFNRSLTQFEFNDDVFVSGSITASGTLSGATIVASTLASCDQLITNAMGQLQCGSIVSLTGANLATIQVRRDTAFTMPALNTFYDIPFNFTDTESNANVIEHNNTNTERVDIKEEGYYLMSYHVNANDATVTHVLSARVQLNNAITVTGSLTVGSNYQNEYSPNVSTNVSYLPSGSYLTLQVSRSTNNQVINETTFTVTKLNGIQGQKGDKGDPGDLTATGADALFVRQSGDTMTGTLTISNGAGLTASGTIATNGNMILNSDLEAADAVLTFGNNILSQTLTYSAGGNNFIFSDDLQVTGNISVTGSISGATLLGAGLTQCDGPRDRLQYNAITNVFSCKTDPIDTLFFTDATQDVFIDANTTSYWDGTLPNVTPSSTNNHVLVTFNASVATNDTSDNHYVFRVERAIGADPVCGSATVVGVLMGGHSTDATYISGSTTFVDTPNTTSSVRYTLCSDANSITIPATSRVDTIIATIHEIERN